MSEFGLTCDEVLDALGRYATADIRITQREETPIHQVRFIPSWKVKGNPYVITNSQYSIDSRSQSGSEFSSVQPIHALQHMLIDSNINRGSHSYKIGHITTNFTLLNADGYEKMCMASLLDIYARSEGATIDYNFDSD
ncbi:MAG: hypothetical protein ACI83O_000885 [Patescibacteria group bacterium]|jgi:hypothetical protein